ncbi:class A beta-lactamase-related serine hydrolase [Streptomyces sp. WAC05292]|uniref:serine hydrolase domain-containing protein n=1 Tax=Streptomyces sp. WAC05292 TaxID=2487418 RepID=UPI000F749FCE|nr:serine hydrolase domain-containing protein [Streptomyces sp. WAC05292]RSS80588.1 class A beta-lactamase-related serine hydrolase [Streptomyces sp. WAC05292]
MSNRSRRPAAVRVGSQPLKRRVTAVVAVLAAALAAGGALPAAAAPATGSGDAVRQGLERLVREDGYPGALAAVVGGDGRTRHHTAGVADLRTGAKVPVDGQVRAGSNTKAFTATVVLQLVGEGKVDLDAPVERYLPGLVRGDGIDGNRITVRQLLQHTSGLPDYTARMMADYSGEASRHTYYQPRTLLDTALAHKALFAPGTGWAYSNTNYVLAGLLVEKVTGRPLAEQITRRVIDRIGLRHTYFPGVGEEDLRGRHPKGYHEARPGGPLQDITRLDPSWGWAAGQLVSTPGDLNRFFSALMGGKLLGAAELAQMRTTVAVPEDAAMHPGIRFGLGVTSTPLSCGGLAWGHGGSIFGYTTRNAVTDDGRAAAVAVTALGTHMPEYRDNAQKLVDTALCR